MPLSHYESSHAIEDELKLMEDEFLSWQKRWIELHKKMPELLVDNYELHTWNGKEFLLEAFSDKNELILIHNMGKSCRYCTLWADNINGSIEHFENRAALAILSPDPSDVQKEFALSRNWSFKMYSGSGSSIIADLGFQKEDGTYSPGLSILQKREGKIYRKTRIGFCPGDLYCNVWHYFALLPSAEESSWAPQFNYL